MAFRPLETADIGLTVSSSTIASGGGNSGKQIFAAATNRRLYRLFVGNNSTATSRVLFYHGTSSSGTAILTHRGILLQHGGTHYDFAPRGLKLASGLFARGMAGNVTISAMYATVEDPS